MVNILELRMESGLVGKYFRSRGYIVRTVYHDGKLIPNIVRRCLK